MSFLLDNILIIAVVGFTLAVTSNVILLFGRKDGITVKDILKSGHMSKKQRKEFFNLTSIRIANIFGYTGLCLILVAIFTIVMMV